MLCLMQHFATIVGVDPWSAPVAAPHSDEERQTEKYSLIPVAVRRFRKCFMLFPAVLQLLLSYRKVSNDTTFIMMLIPVQES